MPSHGIGRPWPFDGTLGVRLTIWFVLLFAVAVVALVASLKGSADGGRLRAGEGELRADEAKVLGYLRQRRTAGEARVAARKAKAA